MGGGWGMIPLDLFISHPRANSHCLPLCNTSGAILASVCLRAVTIRGGKAGHVCNVEGMVKTHTHALHLAAGH